MTGVEDAVLLRLVRNALARRTDVEAGAGAVATAAQRAYEDLARAAAQLIGQEGVDALTVRSVHLVQREHAWLIANSESEQAKGPLAQVIVYLRQQPPAVAAEAGGAVFATFTRLLATFIGVPLTVDLLRRAWPDAFADGPTRGKQG